MHDWLYTCDLIDDPEIIRKYDDFHAHIWPEVAESLKAVGMQDIKIWRLGTRMVMWIMTEDDFDPEEAGRRHLANHPRCQEWEDLMKSFQRRPEQGLELDHPGQDDSSTWTEMTRVFRLQDHL